MRKRSKRVEIYFTEEELDLLTQKVRKSGFSREAFCRAALLDKEIKEAPPADFYKLIIEVRKVGSNLNQLVMRAQTLDFIDTPSLQKVASEIRETEAMLWDSFQSGGPE